MVSLDFLLDWTFWDVGPPKKGILFRDRAVNAVAITDKHFRAEFVRRLFALDQEIENRRADVGTRGEDVRVLVSEGGFSMRRMTPKTCRLCSNAAQFSLACVLSTLGVRPRVQQCSQVVLLCESCIRELCDSPPRDELRDALRDAYTSINRPSTTDLKAV